MCQRLFCIIALSLFCALSAQAEPARETSGDQKVLLLNLTDGDLHGLYLAPSGTEKWVGDILDGAHLQQGDFVKITFPWGARAIWWNIRVLNEQGTVVEWKNVPIRRFRRLTLLYQDQRPVIKGE